MRQLGDQDPTNDHVDDRGEDEVGQPEDVDREEQVVRHDFNILDDLASCENGELEWTVHVQIGTVLKTQLAKDEDDSLHDARVSEHVPKLAFVVTVVGQVGLSGDIHVALIQFHSTVDFQSPGLFDLPVSHFREKYILAEVLSREFVRDLEDRGGVVDSRPKPLLTLRAKVALDHVDVDTQSAVELIGPRTEQSCAEGTQKLACERINV